MERVRRHYLEGIETEPKEVRFIIIIEDIDIYRQMWRTAFQSKMVRCLVVTGGRHFAEELTARLDLSRVDLVIADRSLDGRLPQRETQKFIDHLRERNEFALVIETTAAAVKDVPITYRGANVACSSDWLLRHDSLDGLTFEGMTIREKLFELQKILIYEFRLAASVSRGDYQTKEDLRTCWEIVKTRDKFGELLAIMEEVEVSDFEERVPALPPVNLAKVIHSCLQALANLKLGRRGVYIAGPISIIKLILESN